MSFQFPNLQIRPLTFRISSPEVLPSPRTSLIGFLVLKSPGPQSTLVLYVLKRLEDAMKSFNNDDLRKVTPIQYCPKKKNYVVKFNCFSANLCMYLPTSLSSLSPSEYTTCLVVNWCVWHGYGCNVGSVPVVSLCSHLNPNLYCRVDH